VPRACCDHQIVGTYGAYSVSRAAGAPHITKHHFRHHLQETAHLAHKPLQRAWRAWQFLTRRRGGAQPSTKADAADDAKGAAAANSAGGHAVVNIGAVNGGSKQPWGLFGHRGSSSKATDLPSPAAPGTPSSQDASAHSAKVWTGLDGAASAKASVMASTVAEEDAGEAEYLINPRLALLFSDVWVAGGAISGGLRQRLVCTAKRVCCGSGTKTSDDFEEGAVDGKGAAAADVDKAGLQRKQQCNLDAAAAAGAYFIVPGVSSYFAHSQLHAIMGPSGLCVCLAAWLRSWVLHILHLSTSADAAGCLSPARASGLGPSARLLVLAQHTHPHTYARTHHTHRLRQDHALPRAGRAAADVPRLWRHPRALQLCCRQLPEPDRARDGRGRLWGVRHILQHLTHDGLCATV
jgi:hypothetical protein